MLWLLRKVVRLLFRSAAIALLVWVGRELIRRWVDGTEQPAVSGNWESWRPTDAVATPKEAPATRQAPSIERAPAMERAPSTKQAPLTKPATRRATQGSSNGSWVKPDGSGLVPASHPVKAKVSSRVYRVPGMPGYERSVPDRCYESPEAAEADGFTRATR